MADECLRAEKAVYRESKSNTDWVTKIPDTIGIRFLPEAERLGLYDPKTKTARETDLDLDYIFAEPTADQSRLDIISHRTHGVILWGVILRVSTVDMASPH